MKKFIVCTFAFLFWGFYEMSGGSDFQPGSIREASAEAPAAPGEQVARADNAGMLTQVVASPAAASTARPEGVADGAARSEPAGADAGEAPTPDEDLLERVDNILLTRRDAGSPAARNLTDGVKTIALGDETPEPERDLRVVDGNVVNMRTGPGTSFSVVDQLNRGDEVEVLRSEGDWVKLRVTETGNIGWMANYLVTAAAE